MTRHRSLGMLLAGSLLWPALAAAEADDRQPLEIEPGPTCEAPAHPSLIPQVPLQVIVDEAAVAQYRAEGGAIVLNNRGYGYRPATGTALPNGELPTQ